MAGLGGGACSDGSRCGSSLRRTGQLKIRVRSPSFALPSSEFAVGMPEVSCLHPQGPELCANGSLVHPSDAEQSPWYTRSFRAPWYTMGSVGDHVKDTSDTPQARRKFLT